MSLVTQRSLTPVFFRLLIERIEKESKNVQGITSRMMKIASGASHTQSVNYISSVLSAPREMSHQGVGAQCRANAATNMVRCVDICIEHPHEVEGTPPQRRAITAAFIPFFGFL